LLALYEVIEEDFRARWRNGDRFAVFGQCDESTSLDSNSVSGSVSGQIDPAADFFARGELPKTNGVDVQEHIGAQRDDFLAVRQRSNKICRVPVQAASLAEPADGLLRQRIAVQILGGRGVFVLLAGWIFL